MLTTVVRVRSVSAAVDWYREKFGLEPIHVGFDGPDQPIAAYLIAGTVVALWQLPRRAERAAGEDRTYVVAVIDTDDLAPARNLLLDRGIEVGELCRSENHEYVWFYDLDGNRFELSRPLATQ
ncbi:VOC family protein [Mycobacterium paraterrae]|uniref:VOC family protein n=1 Tax=Mycobacterium paraterrae TaxID=577492 RepID=A0ABY3VJK8_9MYCO|nr:VOC family protein [Mycobacterium paraterrae]UMB69585.1 VOC family protein [Mycobacterium paraterrae]